MDDWLMKTNGSDTLDEKLTFANAEQLIRQCDLKDQSENDFLMETIDCRPGREHSESSTNDVVVDIQNEPSVVSNLLAQLGSSTNSACESISNVLNNDSHKAENDVPREDLQNHSSGELEDVLLSLSGQESVDGCSYGKRFFESTEHCQQASKRIKTSHDFEASKPVTTESQPGISDEADVENPVVPVIITMDQSAELAEVQCHNEALSSSEVEIIPPASDIQADTSHKAQELSTTKSMENQTTQVADVCFHIEKPPSEVEIIPPASDIQADNSHEAQELSTTKSMENQTTQLADVRCHIEKPPVVRIIPPASNTQAKNPYESQRMSSMDNMEGTTECRQLTMVTRSEEPLREPTQESPPYLESHNVPGNSSAIQAASDPRAETLIGLRENDKNVIISEKVSESMLELQHQQPRSASVDVILAKSGIRDEDRDISCTDDAGDAKGLSPFEVSLFIDNIIRRELESDQSSGGSEQQSDDEVGDEGSQSEEKLDENDSGADSESSMIEKEKSELCVENERDGQSQVPCERLSQANDDIAETSADYAKDRSAAVLSCKVLKTDSKSGNVSAADEMLIVLKSDQTNFDSESVEGKASKEIDDNRADISKESVEGKASKEIDDNRADISKESVEGKASKEIDDNRADISKESVEGKASNEIDDNRADISKESVEGKASKEIEDNRADISMESVEDKAPKGIDDNTTDISKESDVNELSKGIDDNTTDISKELGGDSRHSKLLSTCMSPDKATPAVGNDFVGSGESGRADLVPEVGSSLTQESSSKEEGLHGNPDSESPDKSSKRTLGAGDAAECSDAMQCKTEAAVDHMEGTSAESSKKMYDPFEDMDIVEEDAAAGEDAFSLSDEAHPKIMMERAERKHSRFSNDWGFRRNREQSDQGNTYTRDPYGPDRESQGHWSKYDQPHYRRDEQAQWSYPQDFNQNSDREMYQESRMSYGGLPLMRPDLTYRPSTFDPCSSGNMASYGMPPQNFASQPGPLQAPSYMPPPGYMPPPSVCMPPQGGYGVPMPYGGMPMPSYFAPWGQWPTAGLGYPPVQQEPQQQQNQSYQEWCSWWQNYSTWYSSYMSGWNQPVNQQTDTLHLQSQGSWPPANQQCATTSLTSEAPSPIQLPSSKQSTKKKSSAATPDSASSNPKVSYKPTVTKGPILNSVSSSFTPFSAPKLKFSISGPVSAVTQKSTLPTKSSESSGKVSAAGENNDQEGENSIWVGNLPLGTSAVDVRTLISKHGKVIKCKVGAMKSQKDAGLAALITMETADDVAVCIQKLHESYYNGQKILVRKLKQQ